MKAKIALWIFKCIGFVIMSLGFYVRNAEFYPSLMNRITPETVRAEAAIKKIKSGEKIVPGEEGFQTLADVYLASLSASNNNRPIPPDVKVDSFQRGASMESFGQPISMNVEIDLTSTVTQIGNKAGKADDGRSVTFFESSISEMKQKNLLSFGQKLFLAGLTIEIFALLIDFISHLGANRKATALAAKETNGRAGISENREDIPY